MNFLRWLSLLAGIVLVVFSFSIFGNAAEGIVTAAVLLGFVFTFYGIGELSLYFSLPKNMRNSWLLVGGLITLIFGLWAISMKGSVEFAQSLPFVLATWVIFFGCLRVVNSFALKEICAPLFLGNLIIGGIGIVLGMILLNKPFFAADLINIIVFLILLFQGLASIIHFFVYKQK